MKDLYIDWSSVQLRVYDICNPAKGYSAVVYIERQKSTLGIITPKKWKSRAIMQLLRQQYRRAPATRHPSCSAVLARHSQ